MDFKVTDCVTGVFRMMLPKIRLVVLAFNVGMGAPNCNANVCTALPAVAVNVAV